MADEFPEHVVATRRRAVGVKLVTTGSTLQMLHAHKLGAELANDISFLSDKEAEALEKVAKTLRACESNLIKLAKRMGVEV